MLLNSLRDCDEWKAEGLRMSTVSNEACKLYDASLSQYVNWYNDKQLGGVENTLERMFSADPNFVLGHVLNNGLALIGTSLGPANYELYKLSVRKMLDLAEKQKDKLTVREKRHVEAVGVLFDGELEKACDLWERILVEHPNDVMALRFAQDAYFYLGQHEQMRDSVSRVLPLWKSSDPLFSAVHSMHSFGLVQSKFFTQAEISAKKALELNKYDGWATHTICHYYEYKNEPDCGIKYLRETEANWSMCDFIAPHNYWHWSLYHIERGEHEIALDIFDGIVAKNLSKESTLDMVDIVSLLFRLKLDCSKVDLHERWLRVKEVYEKRGADHGYLFNDAHVFMTLSECGDSVARNLFSTSLNTYLENGNFNFLKDINQRYATKLFDSISHFNAGEYERVVDSLYPIRYELIRIGGSNAQRDLFHQMLTQAALRSPLENHRQIGVGLINERIAIRPNSKLTSRIKARFASQFI